MNEWRVQLTFAKLVHSCYSHSGTSVCVALFASSSRAFFSLVFLLEISLLQIGAIFFFFFTLVVSKNLIFLAANALALAKGCCNVCYFLHVLVFFSYCFIFLVFTAVIFYFGSPKLQQNKERLHFAHGEKIGQTNS